MQFITNKNKLLSEVTNNILSSTKNFYALVGYFYFSGFAELAEKLKDKQVQILVGMEVERGLGGVIKEIAVINERQDKRKSKIDIRRNYFKSLVELYGKTDILEGSKNRESFKIFVEKIKNGSLEVRKTKEANHAKLYIFEKKEEYSDNGETPGVVITGSSNLTFSGLRDQFEINVKSYDRHDYKVSIEMFKELWGISDLIVDKSNIDEFVREVVDKVWIDKLPDPYLVYIRVLYELFNIEDRDIKLPSEITKEYFDLEYQKDAIKKGLSIIEKHNGVIIADVVGLGKSIIASAIAANLGLQTIIICPPHLKNQWSEYGKKFKFNPHIYGSGSIGKALKEFADIEGKKLILVDEAHKYRNENTRDYNDLKTLCVGNKVILLTATPFNNKPQDIFSLISLFQIPTKSTIRTVDNLFNRFRDLIIEYKKIKDIKKESERKKEIKKVADKMRDIIFDLVIRRSRIDLEKNKRYKKDLDKQNISFPEVQPPKFLKYQLGDLKGKYINTLEKITDEKKGFVGARYKPTEYILSEKKEKYEKEFEKLFKEKNLLNLTQKNLASFMRRLLVHRFESSIAAFGSTLNNMITSMEVIREWYEKIGVVPILKKGNLVEVEDIIDDSSDSDDEIKKLDENLDKLKKEKGYYYIKKEDLSPLFIKQLEKDIEILERIRQEWFEDVDATKDDPKVKMLKETLREKLKERANRKIIIFSVYSDTVEYVYEKIRDEFKVFRYTSQYASQRNKEIIRKNFDAGLKQSEQSNDYDILIASDAISEGFNLHRAGVVINYDIPYNPTRVIQRVGRINRVNGKVFNKIYIYNAFPTLVGEEETNIKKISTLKINMINALLGTDMKILTDEEEVESFYREKYKEAEQEIEEESWETKYQQELADVDDKILKMALDGKIIPLRTRIRRSIKKSKAGVLVFAKKDKDYIFKFSSADKEAEILSRKDAIELLKAEIAEKSQEVSEQFEDIYEHLRRNLFTIRNIIRNNRADINLANKIEVMKEKFPIAKDYLSDLYEVAVNLRALSNYSERYIRNLDLKQKDIIEELQEEIKPDFLSAQINQANQIEEGEEILILAEELI